MIKSLKKLSQQCGFKYIGDDVVIETISINSSQIKKNSLFVAIVGNRDGHVFIPQAVENGAKALLVSQFNSQIATPQIVVKNTIKALQRLAKKYRENLKMHIFALTGTCGKTSIKEMLVTLLSTKYKVHFTQGNLNNYLGVPITILETPQDCNFLIVEAGTSVQGEIIKSTEIINPDVALITNIGASHLENLKTLDGVLEEKKAIFYFLDKKQGTAVINFDDKLLVNYAKNVSVNKITVSSQKKADVYLKSFMLNDVCGYDLEIIIKSKHYAIYLPLCGLHNIKNYLLAVAVIVALGVDFCDIKNATQNLKSFKGRFELEKLSNKLTLIDDSYNASVPSVETTIDYLNSLNEESILVLSSMVELGDKANYFHKQISDKIKTSKIFQVYLYGDYRYLKNIVNIIGKDRVKYFQDKGVLKKHLIDKIRSSSKITVLVKGARFYKMNDVCEIVRSHFKT